MTTRPTTEQRLKHIEDALDHLKKEVHQMAVDLSKLSASIDAYTAAVNAALTNPPSDAVVQAGVDALTKKVDDATAALATPPATPAT